MNDPQDLIGQLDRFDPRLLSRLAVEAMFLFERSRENAGAKDESRGIQAEVRAVRQVMIDLIERSECCPDEIINALGALRDPALISLFQRCLSWQLANQNAGGVYAAMIALGELGENIFCSRGSRSILDWELNRDLALAYLERFPETGRSLP
jgi:hypothetical protein